MSVRWALLLMLVTTCRYRRKKPCLFCLLVKGFFSQCLTKSVVLFHMDIELAGTSTCGAKLIQSERIIAKLAFVRPKAINLSPTKTMQNGLTGWFAIPFAHSVCLLWMWKENLTVITCANKYRRARRSSSDLSRRHHYDAVSWIPCKICQSCKPW